MRINLISKIPDNASPSYTTFTVEVLEGGNAAQTVIRTLRQVLPQDSCLIDTQRRGRQVAFTIVDVQRARELLQERLPELARLMT